MDKYVTGKGHRPPPPQEQFKNSRAGASGRADYDVPNTFSAGTPDRLKREVHRSEM